MEIVAFAYDMNNRMGFRLPAILAATNQMPAVIQTLTHILAPWQSLYSNSKVVSGTVSFAHLVGLLFGGGFAVATDRATWRAFKATPATRAHALEELSQVHTPVLAGLTLLIGSGILLAAADVETFGKSPVFWIKMGLVGLLGINGLVLKRTETILRAQQDEQRQQGDHDSDHTVVPKGHAEDPYWRRLRATAVASMVLWTTTMLAGTILLTNA